MEKLSRYNLGFSNKSKNDDKALYEVLTCDFDDKGANQLIGILSVSFKDKSYTFTTDGIWKGVDVVPLDIFLMPEKEGKIRIREEFSSAQYTDWMYKIFKRAQLILSEYNQNN